VLCRPIASQHDHGEGGEDFHLNSLAAIKRRETRSQAFDWPVSLSAGFADGILLIAKCPFTAPALDGGRTIVGRTDTAACIWRGRRGPVWAQLLISCVSLFPGRSHRKKTLKRATPSYIWVA
jgi:hypothetical protein